VKFQPGRSGNPGGRPKRNVEIQELARARTADAIAALEAALKSPGERVAAAKELLDRGWGRALQRTENLNTNTKDAAYAVLRHASPATRASLRAVLQQAQLEAQAVEIEGDAE
jgi:hypothetical protein